MSTAATIAVAIVSSGAFSAIVTAVCNAFVDRGKRKREREERNKQIDERLDEFGKIISNSELAILRLTIMNPEMPMSERLIAGRQYIDKGGNGDVKHYFLDLEKQCEANA